MPVDLNLLTPEELGQIFPIIITEYNPDWAGIYLSERADIIEKISSTVICKIEHIGSTSVPGLCAKPTIDILLEIYHDTNPDAIARSLKLLGYELIPKPENPAPHMMLAKGYSSEGLTGQTFHMHIRYPGDWDEIIFRDYLIANPDTASEYADLKKKLSAEFRNDREKYTDSKGDFIRNIVKIARKN